MLNTLTVWNFALLEHVQIEFDKGLNILTGETGAGKSILIDALGAMLGRRLTTDMIRTGLRQMSRLMETLPRNWAAFPSMVARS